MTTHLEKLCEQRGVKLTRQRRTVCRAFLDAGDHPDFERIFERALQLDPKIGRVTIYRTVKALHRAGILSRHKFERRPAQYEEVNRRHYHLIDAENGNVIDFTSDELDEISHCIAKRFGYYLRGIKIELYASPDGRLRVDP